MTRTKDVESLISSLADPLVMMKPDGSRKPLSLHVDATIKWVVMSMITYRDSCTPIEAGFYDVKANPYIGMISAIRGCKDKSEVQRQHHRIMFFKYYLRIRAEGKRYWISNEKFPWSIS